MKEYVRCKACNFIMEKGTLKDKCPACGVPASAFEDYKYNISEKRRIIMELDLHPIILHFPQAISVLIPFFILLSLLLNAAAGIKLLYAVEIITYLLPATVLGSLFTGMFDGKNRFKKITTPALKKKMVIASVLLVITVIMISLVLTMGIKTSAIPVAVLSVVCLILEIILARIGIKLMFAYLPG